MRDVGHKPRSVTANALAIVLALGVAGGAAAGEPSGPAAPARSVAEAGHCPAPVLCRDAAGRRFAAFAVPALPEAAPAAADLSRRVADQRADAPPEPRVTREQAAAIAVRAVPGEVTSVDLEPKGGRLVYVIEIMPPSGEETDVLVDIETGEVLGTE